MTEPDAATRRRVAPRGLIVRRALRVLAGVAFAAVAVPAVARLLGWEAGPLAIAVALMPWVTLASVVPLVLASLARDRWLAGASALVMVLCVAWTVPLYLAETAPVSDDEFVVATVSMTFGAADPHEVVDLVRDHDVDVLALQELTPESAQALREAGLGEQLPYSEIHAEPGFTGTGLWSRLPQSDGRALDGLTSRTVQAVVESQAGPITVLAPHPAAPGLFAHDRWSEDLAALAVMVAEVEGPLVVVGDLNATRDHRGFRDLEAAGLVDAADQAGSGFAPTFPQGRGPFPVAAIDHVMVRDAPLTAVDARTIVVSGADHRGLIATYATG